MSTQPTANKQLTTRDIRLQKGQTPIVCLTAYTAPFARILDDKVDILLVGDSLGMVLYGMDSTLSVPLDMMIQHGKAVSKQAKHACVVVDMPFGSYQASPEQAFTNAARIMSETNCAAVKLEGGEAMADTISFLTQRGIPVMGHVGLMPQHVQTLGGFRYQGRSSEECKHIMRDANAVEQAGAFAVVVEGVKESLAKEITRAVSIPTIGIGASAACDGQVLVTEDMVGLTPRIPKFVGSFGALGEALDQAVTGYAQAVRDHQFPTDAHCYGIEEK